MIRKKTAVLVFMVFIGFVNYLSADSFYDDPTIDLHAHPLQDIRVSSRAFARAEIIEVLRRSDRREKGLIKAVISQGKYSRKIVFAETVSYYGGGGIKTEEGTNIVLSYLDGPGGPGSILVEGYDRTGQLAVLFLLFIAVALLVGRRSIVMPFLALTAGLVIIKIFFIPAVMAGRPPLFYALVTVTAMVIITMISIDKFSRKALTATAGALSGLGIMTVLALIFYKLSGINGFHITNIQLLQYLDSPLKLKSPDYFRHIMVTVLVLGSCGIIMDVAISIASSVKEIAAVSDRVSFKRLFAAAGEVASRITATMINTLIFAYIGASIGVMLVRGLEISSVFQLLNSEFVHIEFYQIVIGGIGFLACAGVTVVVGAWLFSPKKTE